MKPTILAFAFIGVAAAQMQDNRTPQMSCSDRNYGNRQAYHCDVREQTIPSAGRLSVDAGRNGGVTVRGWLRNDVLVRSMVQTWADTDSEANLLAGQVHVNIGAGQVTADGPSSADRAGWAVSQEIFVPQTSDLDLKAFNGGVNISDVRGRITFETRNGGVHLARVAGDVSGSTLNGGVHVELAGNSWEGRQLEATTRNGGVTISMPERYSAHIQAETVNGGVRSDFPVTRTDDLKRLRNLDFNLGSGGPLIHVSTTNGGVKLQRM